MLNAERKLRYAEPLKCLRDITIQGKKYSRGDMLTWQEDGIPVRLVQKLFDVRQIDHTTVFEREVRVKKKSKVVVVKEAVNGWFYAFDEDGKKVASQRAKSLDVAKDKIRQKGFSVL